MAASPAQQFLPIRGPTHNLRDHRPVRPQITDPELVRSLHGIPTMKAVVVASLPADRPVLKDAEALLELELERAGYDEVELFDTASLKLGYCQGEFDCWLRTPGRCRVKDAEQAITAAVALADALVFFGPVSFGGFSGQHKRAIDRLICLVSPFFETRAGLTHHARRYQHYPRQFAVGMLPRPNEGEAATFVALNDANAVNFFAPARGSAVLDEEHRDSWSDVLRSMLANPVEPGVSVRDRKALREELLRVARPDELTAPLPIRRAAILIGSAKVKGTSASEHMARSLGRSLERAGVSCRLHYATEFLREGVTALASGLAIAKADLFLLVTPLYVDALPALATRALEVVEGIRRAERSEALFVPLVNCGFPEPEHVRTALRITRHFAATAGYRFGGALPLGGGGVVTPDRSLDEGHPPVRHVSRALALTAPALAAGAAVPEAALRAILTSTLPEFLYRALGELGFRWQARRQGVTQRELRATPFSLM